jgi:hypothetical protein
MRGFLIIGLIAVCAAISLPSNTQAQHQLNDFADTTLDDIVDELLLLESQRAHLIITSSCSGNATNHPNCSCSASGTTVSCNSYADFAQCDDGQYLTTCKTRNSPGGGTTCTCTSKRKFFIDPITQPGPITEN